MLAVSLHAPTQDLREKILPSAKVYQLKDLMTILKKYEKST
jgi:adenine C2-methylase RlmN of 23S rRNA A2503 and tRNA A37